jgi:hypothetical protein
VDGVDIRISNHSTHAADQEEYGFNAPVVREYRRLYGKDIRTGPFSVRRWRAIQDRFLTQFLRECRELLHRNGRALQMHIDGGMIHEIGNTRWSINNIPYCFGYPWRQWLREGLFDAITLKNTTKHNVHSGKRLKFAREVAAVARKKDVKVYFCSHNFKCDRARLRFQSDYHRNLVREQLAMVRSTRLMDGYILYESAQLTQRDKRTGRLRGSRDMKQLVKECWGP